MYFSAPRSPFPTVYKYIGALTSLEGIFQLGHYLFTPYYPAHEYWELKNNNVWHSNTYEEEEVLVCRTNGKNVYLFGFFITCSILLKFGLVGFGAVLW